MDKFWNLSSLDFLIVDAKVVGRSSDKYHINDLENKTVPCVSTIIMSIKKRTPGKKWCLNDRKIWNYENSVDRSVLERVKEDFLEK